MNSSYDRHFNGIVHTHSSTLFVVAYKITNDKQASEDIVQEAFLKLWQHRAKVFSGNPGGWLYRVVCNMGYRHIKRSMLREKVFKELGAALNSCSPDAADNLITKENDQRFNHLVSRMPRKQQVVYLLSQEEGLRRNEIATHLNLSPNTVKVHLMRAVQFMREHIACIIVFALFFVFNNLILRNSNTKASSDDLNSIKQTIKKDLPDRTVNLHASVSDLTGKTIVLQIVPR